LTVTQPSDGATIAGGKVLIRGSVNRIEDMGVTVEHNGHVYFAMVNHETQPAIFTCEIPLVEGENQLIVKATTQFGQEEELVLLVDGESAAPSIYQVTTNRSRYYVSEPIEVNIENRLSNEVGVGSLYGFDYDFDGILDYTRLFEESERLSLEDGSVNFSFNFPQAGIYSFHTSIVDEGGTTHLTTVPIQIVDPVTLDQLVKSKWDALNEALLRGDVEKAISFFSSSSREKYESALQLLLPRFHEILESYKSFQLTDAKDSYLEYALNREIGGEDHVFLVYFVLDRDGIWRIDSL
jgi:hypothetical protein